MANFNIFHRSTPVQDRIWLRENDEIARKVFPRDLRGWLTKPFAVEEGTIGLLFSNGRLMGELQPGRHDLAGELKKLGVLDFDMIEYVIFVDISDVALDFRAKGLPTSDPLKADIAARLVFRIESPALFCRNLLGGGDYFTVQDLHSALETEVVGPIRDLIRQSSITDIIKNTETRRNLETELLRSMSSHFGRDGIALDRATAFQFFCEAWEKLPWDEKKAAEIVYSQEFLRKQRKAEISEDLAKQTDLLDAELKKAGITSTNDIDKARLGAETETKLSAIDTDRTRLINQLAKDKLLSNEDKDEILHDLSLKKEDRDHEFEKAQYIYRQELLDLKDRAEASHNRDLIVRELEIVRLRHDHELMLRESAFAAGLSEQDRVFDSDARQLKGLLDIKGLKDQQHIEILKAEHALWMERAPVETDNEVKKLSAVKSFDVQVAKIQADKEVGVARAQADAQAAATDKIDQIRKEQLERTEREAERLVALAGQSIGIDKSGTILVAGGGAMTMSDGRIPGRMICPHCQTPIEMPENQLRHVKSCPFCEKTI